MPFYYAHTFAHLFGFKSSIWFRLLYIRFIHVTKLPCLKIGFRYLFYFRDIFDLRLFNRETLFPALALMVGPNSSSFTQLDTAIWNTVQIIFLNLSVCWHVRLGATGCILSRRQLYSYKTYWKSTGIYRLAKWKKGAPYRTRLWVNIETKEPLKEEPLGGRVGTSFFLQCWKQSIAFFN